MSIASELTTLAANKAAIKAAIEAKNPSTAPTDALAQWPASIASIQTGSNASPVAQMYGWPDIKALLNSDTENYAHKAYVLFDALAHPRVEYLCQADDRATLRPVEKAVTSDGATYTPGSGGTHVWDASKLIDGRYGWVAFYSSSQFSHFRAASNYTPYASPSQRPLWVAGNSGMNISNAYGFAFGGQYAYGLAVFDFADGVSFEAANRSRSFFSCNSLVKVCGLDLSKCTNVNAFFSECRSLPSVGQTLDIGSATDAGNMFGNCSALHSVPSVLDFSKCTNVASLFNNCPILSAIPDVLDFSSVSSANNQSNAFNGCFAVRAMPTHVTSKWSLSFASLVGVTDKDSVCTFSGGAVSGGFVGNLNTCPNASQTITLNSAIKNLFSATEQTEIETAMSNKNWTLSW